MSLCRSQFDAYVEFFERTLAPDGAGGQRKTWTSKGFLYCQIKEAPANENLDRDALETQRGVSFFTNYRTDVTVKDRLSLDGNNFNVVSVTRVGKDEKANYRGEFIRIDTDESVWFST